jgi:hypothetical protein
MSCATGAIVSAAEVALTHRRAIREEIDKLRGFIRESLGPAQCHPVKGGTFFRAKRGPAEPSEAPCNEVIDKWPDMIACLLGYVVGIMTDLLEESIACMLPVKEPPQVDADGAQAKTTTRIGVKENSPVVKLLAEHDEGVGSGFCTVFHQGALTILLDFT